MPRRKSTPISSHSSFSPPLHCSLESTNLLSVSMDVPVWDVSCQWNPSICGFLFLASFTQHFFKVLSIFQQASHLTLFIKCFKYIMKYLADTKGISTPMYPPLSLRNITYTFSKRLRNDKNLSKGRKWKSSINVLIYIRTFGCSTVCNCGNL